MNRPLPKAPHSSPNLGKVAYSIRDRLGVLHQAHHEGRDGMFPCIAKLDFSNPKATSVNILKSSHINIEIKSGKICSTRELGVTTKGSPRRARNQTQKIPEIPTLKNAIHRTTTCTSQPETRRCARPYSEIMPVSTAHLGNSCVSRGSTAGSFSSDGSSKPKSISPSSPWLRAFVATWSGCGSSSEPNV